MITVSDITRAIERVAPLGLQEDFDNSGLQVGSPDAEVTGALLCTDVTMAVIDEAVERGFNLIISHHPLIFHPLKRLTGATLTQRLVARALLNRLNVYSAHTSMDNAAGGVSFHMAERLGMTDVEFLDGHRSEVAPQGVAGSGVIGNIAPQPAIEVLERAKREFEVGAVRYSGDVSRPVSRVALCGGAGAFLLDRAIECGAQLFISADVRYHDFLEHNEAITIADIGHYESEHFTKEIFFAIIQQNFRNFAVDFAKSEINQIKYL